jgi:hypothetical protein
MTFSGPRADTQHCPAETWSKAKALPIGIYVTTAVALGYYLVFGRLIRYWSDPHIGAAIVALGFLVFGSLLAFVGNNNANIVGLIGTFLAWPLVLQNEFPRYYNSYSSWVVLNVSPTSIPDGYLETWILTAKLAIVTTSLLLLATTYSLLRLCPLSWRIGTYVAREQGWFVFVVTLFVVAIWYVVSVSPWRIPIFDAHGWNWNARLCVLHVEKRGLQVRETSVAVRAGRNFHITRDDRKLFRYEFQEVHSDGAIPEEDLLRLQPVIYAPPPRGTKVPRYTPPRRWNADRWFVYAQGRPIENLFNVDKSAVPADILAWFYKAQAMDQLDRRQVIERDVCLGFCYDPTY